MQIRIISEHEEPLKRLARFNRRTPTAEAGLAIEAHLEGHRAVLAQGAKLSPATKKRALPRGR